MSEVIVKNENNFFNGAIQKAAAPAEAMINRQGQEVQAAMIIAKKFPRDQIQSYQRIMQACERKSLAECAVYEYPRGGTKVSGPSIRMAEVLAQNWGNLDFGIVELERNKGESQVMAYAWDLETNTRQTKVFSVKHWRDRKGGAGSAVTEERDIYEVVANQGARRMRACVLGIIPGDVIDAAVDQCEKTMASGEKEPLIDRIRKMVTVFSSEFNISKEQIEKRFQHNVDSLSETEMVSLKKIYRSLKDGMADVADYFEKVSGLETPMVRKEKTQDPEKKPESKSFEISLTDVFAGKPCTIAQAETYLKKTGKLGMTMNLESNKTLVQMIAANTDKFINDVLDWQDKEGK